MSDEKEMVVDDQGPVEETVPEPETFSSDQQPPPIPVRIVRVANDYKDPLGVKDMVFQVGDFVYIVKDAMKRLRRRVAVMGLGVFNKDLLKMEIHDAPAGVKDPLAQPNFVFTIQAPPNVAVGQHTGERMAYKVNNSLNGRFRTVKCIGKVLFDIDEGVA